MGGVHVHAHAELMGWGGMARPMEAGRQQGLVATRLLCQAVLAGGGESAGGGRYMGALARKSAAHFRALAWLLRTRRGGRVGVPVRCRRPWVEDVSGVAALSHPRTAPSGPLGWHSELSRAALRRGRGATGDCDGREGLGWDARSRRWAGLAPITPCCALLRVEELRE